MLDMGFETQVRAIMGQIRPDRQILLFSATWPRSIRRLASEFLSRDYLKTMVGTEEETTVNKNVTQRVLFVKKNDKQSALVRLFRSSFEDEDAKILIFCATKYGCDKLCKNLRQTGWPSLAIHGDKTQRERDWVMEQFRSGTNPIMIATDVASRGIHVDDISFVINYDFPGGIEDYIHRIGRTGRAGKQGTAISFFDEDKDYRCAKALKSHLKKSGQEISRDLSDLVEKQAETTYFSRKRTGGYNPY